jgi:hypothetical protein
MKFFWMYFARLFSRYRKAIAFSGLNASVSPVKIDIIDIKNNLFSI